MYEYKKRDKSETATMYYYYMYLLFVSFWFCLQNIYKSGNPNARKQTVIRFQLLLYGFMIILWRVMPGMPWYGV